MANYLKNIVTSKITLLSMVLFLHLLFPLVVNSYNNLAVNCGHSIDTIFENRKWFGDVEDSKLFSIIEPQIGHSFVKAEATPNSNLVNQIPFASARISFFNFTFSFPSDIVNDGTVFLRLHFYPTSYQNFETSKALFTVKVGNLTLLKDFNPSLWLQNDKKTITKEYCLTTKQGEKLNITFIPSITNQSNAYAFINGIEIVSMPSFLYYTNLDDPNYHFKLLGLENKKYKIRWDKALETVYRVSVGGNQVSPSNDTGMFRYWDNDFPHYLETKYSLSVSSSDFAHSINYLNNTIPNYTAPEVVYLTARSYGIDAAKDYNVTWNFEVDSTFTYLVRLHFCEFDWHIKNKGDRVFQIFIGDTFAERNADVIYWSGAHMVPVHKDYAVTMNSHDGSSQIKRVNLSIKLQRVPENINTKYRNVTLNGIEILKISDKNNNLAGLVSKSIDLSHPQQTLSTKTSKTFKIILAFIECTIAFVTVFAVSFGIFWLRGGLPDSMEDNLSMTSSEGLPSLPPHLCRYFTIAEIKAATNNFDDVFIIGVGGFGNVYKGFIDESTPVAIKRLKTGSQQGVNEFMNEIELLSQLRHIHLVSLVGYCNDNKEMILIYEFMQHGTLCEYLYGSNNKPLLWKQRLEILLGAARGLHYLHAEVKNKIIHRDVKSTNILLDDKWVAKVSDFGLSKVGPTGISTTHVSTMVKGSLGYLDPEYYMLQRLTLKSDVYSFGVVLLEVLCARPPLVRDLDKKTASLVCWFQTCYNEGVAIKKIVDPFLRDSITDECLKYYCKLALSCLHDDGTQRPSMTQVVGGLDFVLQLVVSEEDSQFGMTQKERICLESLWFSQFLSDEGTHLNFARSSQFLSDEESDLYFARSHTYKETTVSARASTHDHSFFEIENPRPRSYSCQNFQLYN